MTNNRFKLNVGISKVHPGAKIPEYATAGSAGFDICLAESVAIKPGETVLARTGLVIETPEGHALILAPRSSTFKKYGIKLANTVGIIDPDYRGPEDEILLALHNTSDTMWLFEAGDRLVQGIFVLTTIADWEVKEVASSEESRGGWGSTG